MIKTPAFSIIIPVYNTEKYIARCLESCVKQSFGEIEIVVVDDCGSDQAIQIAQEYAQGDRRIKIIRNSKNLGLFLTRISGERCAEGEYIIHLDSDDFIDIKTCEKIKKALESEYQKSGSKADICWFASKRLFSKKEEVFKPYNGVFLGCEILRNNMFQWEIWGKAYKRELIQKANEIIAHKIKEEQRLLLGEDAIKSFVINLLAQKCIGLDEVMYFYCDNPASITKSRDNSQTALRNSAQLDFVIKSLDRFDTLKESEENPYYLEVKQRVQRILGEHQKMWEYQAFIANRFEKGWFVYPRVYLESLSLKRDYRRVGVRIFVYFLTGGFVKI